MKAKALFLLSLLPLSLLSCSNQAEASSPSSSEPTSSQVSSSEAASSSQASSSEAASSGSSESASSSSQTPEPAAFSNGELAAFISQSALKYDDAPTASYLLSEAKRLDPSFAEEKQSNNASFLLLSHLAFKNSLPSRRGARGFEFYENAASPTLSGYEDASPYVEAFRFLTDAGIIDASSFAPAEELTQESAWTYLDRLHNYYGSSPEDDFFSYANFDQRISDCQNHGASSSSEDVYAMNLASEESVSAWSKEMLLENHDAYSYYHALTSIGESNVLSAMIEEYMAATSASGLLDLIINNFSEHGYAPIYDSLTFTTTESTYFSPTKPWEGKRYAYIMLTPGWSSSSTAIASGSAAYQAAVNEYTPLFSSLLGDEAEGAKRATDYADFLYEVTLSCEKYRTIYYYGYTMPSQADATYSIAKTGKTFNDLLTGIGMGDATYLICDMENYKGLFDLFEDEHLEQLKAYALACLIDHYQSLLPDTSLFNEYIGYPNRNEDEGFYYASILPAYTSNLINQYTKTQGYADDVATLNALVSDLKSAMSGKIESATWLSEAGKATLKAKLSAMRASIGMTNDGTTTTLPENAYATLGSEATALDYRSMYEKDLWERQNDKLGTAPEDVFLETVSQVTGALLPNAVYLRDHNGIRVTLGMIICQANPSRMSRERLLGGLGLTIGHEIGHGFDATGFSYDSSGTLNPALMGEADRAAFSSLTKAYQEYMDGYEAMPGLATDGAQVLDEAVADNIGLSLSLAVGKQDASFDEGIFFREYAKAYGGYMSRGCYQRSYASDSHPIQRARVNRLLSSSSEFHESYGVEEGDFMYVAPEDRISFY